MEDEVFDPDSEHDAERRGAQDLADLAAEAFADEAFQRALTDAAGGIAENCVVVAVPAGDDAGFCCRFLFHWIPAAFRIKCCHRFTIPAYMHGSDGGSVVRSEAVLDLTESVFIRADCYWCPRGNGLDPFDAP